MELHYVNDVVRIGVLIACNGEPSSGESPKIIVQRRSDSLFFDGSSFSTVRNELSMKESAYFNLLRGLKLNYIFAYNDVDRFD